jgi:group I intron endonuclease
LAIGYQIYCTVQGVSQTYFGITTQPLEKRFQNHLSRALNGKSNYYIHNAIRKYGAENFKIQQLFSSESFEDCKKWEIATIAGAKKAGLRLWNLTDGGDGALGFKHTLEARKRMSDSRKGVPLPESVKTKLSLVRTGKKPSLKQE